METELTQKSIATFQTWLRVTESKSDEADYKGVLEGLKWSLSKLGAMSNIQNNLETILLINQQVMDELNASYFENKINAYWNLGFASAIFWVLEELKLPLPEENPHIYKQK